MSKIAKSGLFDDVKFDDVTHSDSIKVNIENMLNFYEYLRDITLPLKICSDIEVLRKYEEDLLINI